VLASIAARMFYLSDVQNRRVVDENGQLIGKVADVIVASRDQFPPVQGIVVSAAEGERVVRWSDVASVGKSVVVRATAPTSVPPDGDGIRAARDLLDKQIVDTHGAKVVRVNDLQFAEVEGVLRLVGADVGMRGILRRLGVEQPADKVASAVGRRLPRGIIPWHLVEPLEASAASVRLTIPHQKLALLHPADIADIVEEMSVDERRSVFEQLDVETAAEALSEVDPEMQVAIVDDLDEERAADILEEMAPDEAADLLGDLPEERREELIDLMQPKESEDVEELLAYDENSAGGIMTTEYLALRRGMTTAQAIDKLRELKPDPEVAYYLYVIDEDDKLVGVVSLRDLVVASPETALEQVMNPHVLKADAQTHKEEVAAVIAKYDLLALPVIDARGRLIGAVTVDDVVELMLPRGWRKRPMRDIAR
jgi:magnesium transporter